MATAEDGDECRSGRMEREDDGSIRIVEHSGCGEESGSTDAPIMAQGIRRRKDSAM
jgi:hypothetical protein